MYIDNENRRLIAENAPELEELERLAYHALLATIEAPERRSSSSVTVGLRWDLIGDMRELAQRAGLNWIAACRSYHKRVKASGIREELERLEARSLRVPEHEAARVLVIEGKRAELAKLEAALG